MMRALRIQSHPSGMFEVLFMEHEVVRYSYLTRIMGEQLLYDANQWMSGE